MDSSVFTDKSKQPNENDLAVKLGKVFALWNSIKEFVCMNHKSAFEEWNYSKSFGWNCRIRDKKRVIIYLMPGGGMFKASFVFGAKAAEEAVKSKISSKIKDTIKSAKVYAEGRGFRLEVTGKKIAGDIKTLIDIKLSN